MRVAREGKEEVPVGMEVEVEVSLARLVLGFLVAGRVYYGSLRQSCIELSLFATRSRYRGAGRELPRIFTEVGGDTDAP